MPTAKTLGGQASPAVVSWTKELQTSSRSRVPATRGPAPHGYLGGVIDRHVLRIVCHRADFDDVVHTSRGGGCRLVDQEDTHDEG